MCKRPASFFSVVILVGVALLGYISSQAQFLDFARQQITQQSEEIALLQRANHDLATKHQETDRWTKALEAQVGKLKASQVLVERLKGRVADSQEAAMAYTCAIRNLLRAE
ncbi:MAG: hypothetical protein AAB647_04435, partial [Patescibacteria group bacterium]